MRFHLFPFRTEKLSSLTPMVLRFSRGRVGSRLFKVRSQDLTFFCACRSAGPMAVCTCLPDRRQVLRRVSAVGYAAVSWPLGRVGQPLFACVRETWKAVCVYGCLRTAACVLQLSTCDLRLATCDLRLAACGLCLAAFDLRPATCGLQTATCDCDLRSAVCALRDSLYGTKNSGTVRFRSFVLSVFNPPRGPGRG